MWMRTHSTANCPMVYNNRLITTSGTVSISMQSTYVCTTGNVRTIACEWRLWDFFSAAAMNVTFWQRQTCIVLCCINYVCTTVSRYSWGFFQLLQCTHHTCQRQQGGKMHDLHTAPQGEWDGMASRPTQKASKRSEYTGNELSYGIRSG